MKLRAMSKDRARLRPLQQGTEREMLESMLDFFRSTVVAKASGLSDSQASAAAVPTATLTVAGLVKHLTATERFWFSIDFAALDVEWPWTDDNTWSVRPHDGRHHRIPDRPTRRSAAARDVRWSTAISMIQRAVRT